MPPTTTIQALFRDPRMFDSNQHWRDAGFAVEGEGAKSNIMVASHPAVPGYLFKKYSAEISLKQQYKNYRRRIEGAEKLRAFITKRGLSQIVVPQKYLHALPSTFTRKDRAAYVLVVEALKLLPDAESKQRYQQISDETLRQLCAALVEFRGLDSGIRNVPFTDKGQIAFIDTERWNESKDTFLRRLREHLTSDRLAFAEKLYANARR